MEVAAVQYKARKGRPAESLEALLALARRAVAGETDLLVLPEMAVTGYVFETAEAARAVAEPPHGPTAAALGELAREAGTWIVAGFPEDAGERLYNSALVIDREGAVRFVYRKTLLYELDTSWATPGDSGYATFDTGRGTFTVGICMDLNDDGFVAWCAEARARAIAFPTNWLDQDHDIWPYWAWRIDGLPSAIVAANTWGAEGATRFRGTSAVIDQRTVLAGAPATGDAILRASLAQLR